MCSVAVRSQRRTSTLVLAGALLVLASACGGHFVARGSALYTDGHYVEAAEVFEQTEERLTQSSNRDRARFGVYRGATFLKLGDVPHAARWLGYARSIVRVDNDALNDDELVLLDDSLRALEIRAAAPAQKTEAEVARAPQPAQTSPTQ
jgi:hypothetical protein